MLLPERRSPSARQRSAAVGIANRANPLVSSAIAVADRCAHAQLHRVELPSDRLHRTTPGAFIAVMRVIRPPVTGAASSCPGMTIVP
jgi:hypothetical protein